MSDKVIIEKKNHSILHVQCDFGIANELSDFFSFFVPGYKYMPAFRNKVWDGKIRLFNVQTNELTAGLYPFVKDFCDKRNYEIELCDENNYGSPDEIVDIDPNKIMDFVENDTYIHGIYKCNLCVYDDNYNKNIHLIDTMYMNVYEQNIILDIIKKKCPLHIETKEFLIKYGILTQPRMKELLEDMTEYIKTQTLPKKKKWDRKVKIAFEDFMNIIFKYDRDGKFCSNEIILKKNAYKYMKNNNRTKYIYSEQYTHKSVKPITDEDLFSLFNPKTKPKKTKNLTNKSIIKPTIEPTIEPIIEPTNAFIEPKPLLKLYNLKIEYVYNVEKDKILENHLNYIVNYLDRFTKLYETYNSVLVIKSYDKYYTKHKYFNFRFGRDKYASKCFHVYLTDDLSDIVNITYIESIELG